MLPGLIAGTVPTNGWPGNFSRKRSMLLVWENATPELPDMYETGKLKPYPVEF